ncbi:MAG: hypothetical protein ACR2FY_09155 [Pirellulaceae bacterium]
MSEVVNPYAPPSEVNQVSEDSAVPALRRLGGPAMGLLILSGMSVPGVILVPFLPIVLLVRVYAMHDPPTLEEILGSIAFAVMSLSNCVILVGAWNMRRGTKYKLAYTTAVLSCIPVLSASGYLGIPFGIWALIVLHRRDVKEAFARNSDRAHVATAVAE